MLESGLKIIRPDYAQSGREFLAGLKENRDDPAGLGNRLLGGILDTLNTSEDTNKLNLKETEEINRKTPDIVTTPEFLDETANMLGRSIEGILGVGRDTTAEEMLEELRVANEQRAAQTNQPNAGATDTGS